MVVKVRSALKEDLEAATQVGNLAFGTIRHIYRPLREVVAQNPSSKRSSERRLVALIGGRVVGTVRYWIESQSVHLLGLATHPDFTKRGIARSLVENVEEQAREEGADSASLFTIRETGNVAIFEKLGYSVVHEESAKCFESDIYDTLVEVKMEKQL